MDETIRLFFEESDLARQAAKSIKDGRTIRLKIDGADYTFTKQEGLNRLLAGAPESPDLTFSLPSSSATELATKKFSSVGQVGLHIFEKMLSNDPSEKIEAKLHIGFLSLMTGGYLGVLAAGGSDVAKFLATKGLGNAGKLKDAIAKLRG